VLAAAMEVTAAGRHQPVAHGQTQALRRERRRVRAVIALDPDKTGLDELRQEAFEIDNGARMRERRLALNLSQAGLGEVLGVSFQQGQKYEGGKNRVSAARLFEICRILNLSLSSMFERNPQA